MLPSGMMVLADPVTSHLVLAVEAAIGQASSPPEQQTVRAHGEGSVSRWRRSSRGRCTRRWPPCIAGTMLQRGPRKSIQECTGNRWQLPQCTGTRWQLPQCTGTRGSYPSATDGSYPSALVTDGSDPSLFEIRTENPNESVLEWASVCADCLYV